MLTILLGSIPALVLRFVIIKKPVGWVVAIGIGLCVAILSILILTTSDFPQSLTTQFSGAIGALSIIIVRTGAEKKKTESEKDDSIALASNDNNNGLGSDKSENPISDSNMDLLKNESNSKTTSNEFDPSFKNSDSEVEQIISKEKKKILQIQIKNVLIPFEFILNPNETMIYSNNSLTEYEAKEIAVKLNDRYPRLSFEVKDFSDPSNPFAPLEVGIVGMIKPD